MRQSCFANIPNKVTKIGYSAFDTCSSLETIVLPENVKIGAEAFSKCHSLGSVRIPSSVKYLDYSNNVIDDPSSFGPFVNKLKCANELYIVGTDMCNCKVDNTLCLFVEPTPCAPWTTCADGFVSEAPTSSTDRVCVSEDVANDAVDAYTAPIQIASGQGGEAGVVFTYEVAWERPAGAAPAAANGISGILETLDLTGGMPSVALYKEGCNTPTQEEVFPNQAGYDGEYKFDDPGCYPPLCPPRGTVEV